MKSLLPYITNSLGTQKLKYEVHHFDSGAVMIDIWINDKFYVIQIYGDEIGLSLVTDENAFEIIPDKSYKNVDDFMLDFEKIIS